MRVGTIPRNHRHCEEDLAYLEDLFAVQGLISVPGARVRLRAALYGDGSLCILAVEDDGQIYGKLTFAQEATGLQRYEFLVKTWSENSDWAERVLFEVGGLFEDTGFAVPPPGFVKERVPIYRVTNT